MRRSPPPASVIPSYRASTCWSCSPSSIQRASRCRPPPDSPRRWDSKRRRARRRRRDSWGGQRRHSSGRSVSPNGPSGGAPMHRRSRCSACAGRGRARSRAVSPRRAEASAGCSRRCPNGRRRRPASVRATWPSTASTSTRVSIRFSATAPRSGRGSAPTHSRRSTPSRRAIALGHPMSLWQKPAPVSARRSATSPPPRYGPRAPTRRCGCRPTPKRCSGNWMPRPPSSTPTPRSRSAAPSSARAARTTSAC